MRPITAEQREALERAAQAFGSEVAVLVVATPDEFAHLITVGTVDADHVERMLRCALDIVIPRSLARMKTRGNA